MTSRKLLYPEDKEEYERTLEALLRNTEIKISAITGMSGIMTGFILGFCGSFFLFLIGYLLTQGWGILEGVVNIITSMQNASTSVSYLMLAILILIVLVGLNVVFILIFWHILRKMFSKEGQEELLKFTLLLQVGALLEEYDKLTNAKINREKWCIEIYEEKGIHFEVTPREESTTK